MEQMLCPPMSCTASYPRMQIMFTLVPWRWFKFLSKPCVSQCQCWPVVVTRKEESITDAMQCIASEMPDHATRPNGERRIEWETFSNRRLVGWNSGRRRRCETDLWTCTNTTTTQPNVFWQMCTECGINRFSFITNASVDPDKTFGPQMLSLRWLSMDLAFWRETFAWSYELACLAGLDNTKGVIGDFCLFLSTIDGEFATNCSESERLKRTTELLNNCPKTDR